MSRARVICFLAAVLLSLPAAVRAAAPGMPRQVQQAIKRHSPEMAYVPTRLPAGYRYAKWVGSRAGFEIWFSNRQRSPLDLGYQALAVSCSSFGKSMRTFDVNGVKVYWSATYEDQQAWRCLARGRTKIVLASNRSVPGDDATNTPAKQRDALDLVRIVAYAGWIR